MDKKIVTSLPMDGLEPVGELREFSRTTALQRGWAIAYRQRYPLILSVAGALLLGVLATLFMPRQYTASSSVQIEQQAPQVIAVPDLDPESADANRFLQTQLDRVLSRRFAIDVARTLDIEGSPSILAAIGVEDGNRESVIQALQETVIAELGLNTRLARISATTGDPVVSAALANAYAEALVADNLSGKVETSSRAQTYLLEQLEEAKRKLEESERGMLAYARSAGLTGTTSPEAVSMGSEPAQQVGQLTNSLAAATARRIDAQQEWLQVRGTSAKSLAQVQENRAYQELLAQKARFQVELAQDRQRHTDEYPSVAATQSQIKEIDREIAALAGNIKQSFNQRYRAAARQEAQLKATIGSLRNTAMSEQARGVGYNSLARDVETSRTAYDGLLQRYKAVSAAAGAPAANISLMDQAEPPREPSSPKPLWNLAFAGLVGLIVGMSVALFREQLHKVVRTVEDLEQSTHISAIGTVPALESGQNMATELRLPHSAQSEAYSSLAAAVQQASPGKMPKTILLTSAQANEGKSTSTWGLARGFRTLGYRVLVINADLRNPSRESGFAEVLAGTLDPRSVEQMLEKSAVAVFDAGTAEANPVSLLSPSRVRPVLAELATMADIILIDGPPILGLADAVLLASSVDSVLMVVEANRTQAGQIDVALSRLPLSVPVAGLLTKFDARKAGASYGSYKYYSYGEAGAELRTA